MSSTNHVEIGYMHDLDHLELSAHPTRIWAPRKRVAHEHPIYLKGNVWRSKDCRNLKVVAKHSVRDGGDCAENHWQDSGSTLLSRVISFFLSQKKEKLSNNMWRESSVISLTERKMLLWENSWSSKVCGCYLVHFSCSPFINNYITTTKFVLH